MASEVNSTTPAQSNSIPASFGYPDVDQQLRESEDTIVHLKNETISLRNEREQLVNELNSLRESQFDALERTKREVSLNYDHRVANLQQSLVDTERRLQNVEQQFEETKRAFSEQNDKHMQLLAHHDQKHAQDLTDRNQKHAQDRVDRDQKHAEQITRIMEELESRPLEGRDPDEQEAERLKMIKDKMKEMHEREKKKMADEHSREIELLKDDLQKKMNEYTGQAEVAANAQIKVFHQQCVDALRAMEEKNRRMNSIVDQMKSEMERLIETAKQEKATLEEKYDSLLESSSAEKISLEDKYTSLLKIANMEKVECDKKYGPLLESAKRESSSLEEKYSSLLKSSSSEKVSHEERYASLLDSTRIERASLEEKYASLLESSRMEKISLEKKYTSLLESHSAEVVQVRENKFLLEEKLSDWTEKASQLESKLASTESHNEAHETDSSEQIRSLRSLVGEYEAKLKDAEAHHQQELAWLHDSAEKELAHRMLESQEQNQRKIEDMVSRYESQLSTLKEANVMALNESTDKASLEVAEEHMKSLHEQLNRFRNQEQTFETRLADMKRQYSEDAMLIRKQCVAERDTEVRHAREEVASRIEDLEMQLASLVQTKDHSDVQIKEFLHAAHQKELNELKKVLASRMEMSLTDLRCELVASHQEEMENLKKQLIEEFEVEKVKLEKKVREEGEEVRRQTVGEMEASLIQLKALHQVEVSKLNESRSQIEKVVSSKSEEKIKELHLHISELEVANGTWESAQNELLSQLEQLNKRRQELEQSLLRMESERKQLSEDCDRFQKRVKTLEVDASISRSAEEHFQKMVEQNTQLLNEKQAALDVKGIEAERLAARVVELESKVDNSDEERKTRELECQRFVDQLASKNQAFADLQVENDSLKTSLDSLTKRHQMDVEVCDRLKTQLQNSWGVSEEIEVLKQQVTGLVTYRDHYGDLVVKVESLEEIINCKEGIITEIQRRFDEASHSLEEASKRGLHYEEENSNYAKQVEVLRSELLRMEESRTELRHRVGSVESALTERNRVINEMEQVISELELKLKSSESDSQDITLEASKAEEDVKELSSKLKRSASKEKLILSELQEKEETIKELNTKLSLVLGTDKKRAVEMEKRKEAIDELNSKLVASLRREETLQSELLKKEQMIVHLNGLAYEKQKDSSDVDEMADTIEALQTQVSTLEQELSEKTHIILDLNRNMDDLEAKLSSISEDMTKLEEERSQMQLDLLEYQNESQASNAEQEWAERCSKLEEDLAFVCEEKESLMSQLADLRNTDAQPASSTSNNSLEAKVKEQEKTIKEMRALLAAKESSPSSYRVPFDQEFLVNPLGATLTRARKTLVEKLQEKDAIEKELSIRRAKLERQMSEKQRLEDLLFEKKRFEQELQNQKSLLKKELEDLEARNSFGRRHKVK